MPIHIKNQADRKQRSGRPMSVPTRHKPRFTVLQGQYLAFIRTYTLIHRTAPAEADMQRFFRVSPPSIHQMILTLQQHGLIYRVPGQARSIQLLIPPEELPRLEEVPEAGKS